MHAYPFINTMHSTVFHKANIHYKIHMSVTHFPTKFSNTELFPALWPPIPNYMCDLNSFYKIWWPIYTVYMLYNCGQKVLWSSPVLNALRKFSIWFIKITVIFNPKIWTYIYMVVVIYNKCQQVSLDLLTLLGYCILQIIRGGKVSQLQN